MADPGFLAEAKKARLAINPLDGAKLLSSIQEFLTMPTDVRAKVVQLLVQ